MQRSARFICNEVDNTPKRRERCDRLRIGIGQAPAVPLKYT
jgi:hypothetical protein